MTASLAIAARRRDRLESLAERITEGPPFAVRDAVELITDCLRGLHAVHDAAVRLAKVQREHGDVEQQQDRDDDPPPEYAPAIHQSAKDGATDPAAGSCACS